MNMMFVFSRRQSTLLSSIVCVLDDNENMVRDVSSLKDDIYPGYHVCEATVVAKKEKYYIVIFFQLKVKVLNR